MNSMGDIHFEAHIVSLRVQYTLFGPRAEIARAKYRRRFVSPHAVFEERVGTGPYRRVRRSEVTEVALFQATQEANNG